ncbi:hypothetical protein QQZ08_000412 [Neonectria magnoliae]|uniref:Ankyrin n=1 Tax=Neonectria magnoliae TaxID=2732573 RepID=A0ABR1IH30_9HYPO
MDTFTTRDPDEDADTYPFLDYSANHWGGHFRKASISEDTLIDRAIEICDPTSTSYSIWPRNCWVPKSNLTKECSALLTASFFGHVEIVKKLLDTEVDVNSKDKEWKQAPLLWASGNGREAIVKLLLQVEKVDVDSKNMNDRTPLSEAAMSGHEAIVKLLLETEKVGVDSKDNIGRTPLLRAAMNGHEAIVKLLLETGKVDVNSKDGIGRTPLLWAV